MVFTCDICGKIQKRTFQHVAAGHFDGTVQKKICINCHRELNSEVSKASYAVSKGIPVNKESLIGTQEWKLETGSFSIVRDQQQIKTTQNVGYFLEIHGIAKNFDSKDYPMTVTYGSGTVPIIKGGSIEGKVDYVLVYHPHESNLDSRPGSVTPSTTKP